MTKEVAELIERLLAAASEAAQQAYAPFSGIRVGAALNTADGDVVSGCNVENSSLGLTVCAERCALFRAVASKGASVQPNILVVVRADGGPIAPCGACRQVLAEFNPEALVVFRSDHGIEQRRLLELLPDYFRLDGEDT